MSFFPAFLNLENKKILIVGGGKIAGDKISRLLNFTKDITIISPKIDTRVKNLIENHSLTYKEREYQKGDLKDFFIVVAAVDDIKIQEAIFKEAKELKVLVNSVDSTDFCDFIFPSFIKRGDLTIAFSTSGISPSFSKYLKKAFESLIPENIETFLKKLKSIRENMPKGKKRRAVLDKEAKEYIEKYFKRIKDV